MRFLTGLLMGVILSASAGLAASDGKGDATGFNRSEQEKRFDYFRQRQQQQDVQNIYRQQQKQQTDKSYRRQPC
jgi:hypothetical protein